MSDLAAAASCALVLVDLQTKVVKQLSTPAGEALIENVSLLLRTAFGAAIPVVTTVYRPSARGPLLAAIADPAPDRLNRTTRSVSCPWHDDQFANALAITGRKQLALCGCEAHAAVLQTALLLQRNGYQVFVVADAVASQSSADAAQAMRRVADAGVIVASTRSLLAEWTGEI